jgi:hypothetical protein
VVTNSHLYTELITTITTTTSNIVNDAISAFDAGIYGIRPYSLPKGGGDAWVGVARRTLVPNGSIRDSSSSI